MGNTAQHCRQGLFEDSDFAGDLEDSNINPQEVSCVFLEVEQVFLQETKLLSRTVLQSLRLSLDAGLRLDGLLALDLWDTVIEVLRSTNNTVQPIHNSIQETGVTLRSKAKTQTVKRRQKVEELNDVDYVPTNSLSCTFFEYSEAVIKMIIKGRSPTMRHVSRSQRGCC